MLDPAVLTARFSKDVDEIASNLIRLYGLKFTQSVEHLSSPLLRWLDFRLRYIDPALRPLALSDRMGQLRLPEATQKALENFYGLVRSGADINPYQGRGLILRNDTSGPNDTPRTDWLWADWGIHHFHLSLDPVPEGQFFSKSADYLAFCYVAGNVVAFIDVLPHPDIAGFSNLELMKTVYRNWPEFLERYELKGLLPGDPLTDADIHTLRSKGSNAALTFDGRSFMGPGHGLTSAGTPLKLTRAADTIHFELRALAESVCDSFGQVQQYLNENGIVDPEFLIAIAANGLSLYEERSATAFTLPKPSWAADRNGLETLRDLVAPEWALTVMLRE